MNIKKYYLKNGEIRYKVSIYLGKDPLTGKEKRTNRQGFKTKREAEQAFLKAEETYKNKNLMTFTDVYNLWKIIYKDTVKESTYKTTTDLFRLHILPTFGKAKFDDITYQVLQSYAIKKSKELKNYKECISYMSLVFKHAIRLKQVDNNPCELVILPKEKQTKKVKNYWNIDQVKSFLNYAQEDLSIKWYLYFSMLLLTGMRRGEGLALTWSNVDLDNGIIKVRKTTTRGINGQIIDDVKTESSKRDIYISEELVNLLKQWKYKQVEIYGILPMVFNNKHKGYITQSHPQRYLDYVISKHDLPRITVHGLRHTHATLLFNANVDIKAAQERLGHSKYQVTMDIYTHLDNESKKETAKKIVNFLST